MLLTLAVFLALAGLVALIVYKASDRDTNAGRTARAASIFSFLTAALLLFLNSVTIIPAGHVGIPVLFGQVKNDPLPEGMHLINPLLKIVKMSVRTQELKEAADVPSSEGLIIATEASLLFNLNSEKAPEVYRTLGENYVAVFVEPQFRSHLRSVTASFEAKALYTSQREFIENKISESLTPIYKLKGIEGTTVLLRKIELPKLVTDAIERKLRAEQEAQQMTFVLQKEKQEAERKRVEAQGIADFQRIVTLGISPQLLKWKGIEATERLAASPNAKIVIVGSGRDGLPIILNTDK